MKPKFGALAANVSETFKVVLIDPLTDQSIKDEQGNEAFIEVMSTDSDEGRRFDKELRTQYQRRAMRGRGQDILDEDMIEQNIAKLARLTKNWHLVDPDTKAVLDVPCTVENAKELYSDAGTAHIYRQVWLGASETANFIRRSSRS